MTSAQAVLLVTQPCPTLCSPWTEEPGHGILQARILEWVAISFSKGSSGPRDRTRIPCTAGNLLAVWATMEARELRSSWSRAWSLGRLSVFSRETLWHGIPSSIDLISEGEYFLLSQMQRLEPEKWGVTSGSEGSDCPWCCGLCLIVPGPHLTLCWALKTWAPNFCCFPTH